MNTVRVQQSEGNVEGIKEEEKRYWRLRGLHVKAYGIFGINSH